MKKTLIVATIAAVVSTGAFAKPAQNHAPAPHNNQPSVHQTMKHNAKPAVHAHTGHHNPTPYVAHVRPRPSHPAPMPPRHHHHSNSNLFGDALIAFAILATAAM